MSCAWANASRDRGALRLIAAAVLGLLPGCGGSSGRSPTAPTAVATPGPEPVRVVVVSAETGTPVAGARATVAGAEQTTGPQGAFTAPAGAPDDALVDVVADGFFDRQTTLGRGAGSGRVTLWPLTSPTGLNESFTRAIVYTGFDEAPPGGEFPLRRWRPGQGEVRVLLGRGFDPSSREAVDNQAQAAAEMNELLGGSAFYLPPELFGAEPPIGSVLVGIDPGNPTCVGNALAFTRRFVFETGEIGRVELVYCTIDQTRRIDIARHEFGHTIGLQHSPDDFDLMFPFDTATRFSDRERLVVRLMYQRPAGNRFPDNDREAGGSLGRMRVETIVCGI